MKFLEGYKTKIGAALLAAGAMLAWWHGALDTAQLTMLLGVAIALAGLADKFQRYLPFIVQGLESLREQQKKVPPGVTKLPPTPGAGGITN